MPAPTSNPHRPPSARLPYPVQLFLGVSLAGIVLLVGLVAWRFVGVLRPSEPAANERRSSVRSAVPALPRPVVEIAAEAAEPNSAAPVPLPANRRAGGVSPLILHDEIRGLTPPARLPEPLTADQIVEQRLRAGEDDLRDELGAVPELRLLSDDEVKKIRLMERAALGSAVKESRAAVMVAQQVIRAEQRARRNVRGANILAAQERSAVVANGNAALERIAHQFNLRLQQTMRQSAVQSGLPLRSGPSCQLAPSTASVVEELSKNLRAMGFVTVPGGPSRASLAESESSEGSPSGKTKAFQVWCDQQKVEQFSGTVPTLMQMLQIEDEATRLLLVRELSRIKSNSASAELAGRAIMDLSPEVRRAALAALERRPSYEYAPVLLRGLSYPWPPVADRAAFALRMLKPQDTAGKLVDLLDQPAPSVPVLDPRTNQYHVRELVRLNHLRNCLLCHASSENKEDGLVRGLVPTPGTPLPRATAKAGGGYYAGARGNFVRADITFIHQDFSVVLPDKSVAPWPSQQRFDFVTRERTVPADELPSALAASGNYPQRESVLYALRGITGKDAGDSTAKWQELLGIAKGEDADRGQREKDKTRASH